MRFISKLALMAFAVEQFASAHTGVTKFFVDGVDQGLGVAYRMNRAASQFTAPVEDLSSTDMACGFGGTNGVSRVAEVNDGSTVTFLWSEYPGDHSRGVIDPSHHGSCAVYMKKVDSAIEDPGAGNGWFKIWDDGYDEATQTWCTNKLINADGLLTVQLPQGLVGGYYLIRPELLALNNAAAGNPQFFLGCAQVFLKSSGTKVPLNTVPIPGYVSAGEKSVNMNVWTRMSLPYSIPGPAVTTFEDTGRTIQTVQTEGMKPDSCIVENGNWCGFEVTAYSTESGCWSSAEECWRQGKTCWSSAGPTGGEGCTLWESKCQYLDDQCTARNFNGPPNAGEVLTPAHIRISPPSPLGPTMIGTSVVAAVATLAAFPGLGSNQADSSAETLGSSAPLPGSPDLLDAEMPMSYSAASPTVLAALNAVDTLEASDSGDHLPACDSAKDPSGAMSGNCRAAILTVTAIDDVTVTATVTAPPTAETFNGVEALFSEQIEPAMETEAADIDASYAAKIKRAERRPANISRRRAHPTGVSFQSAAAFHNGAAQSTGFLRVAKGSVP